MIDLKSNHLNLIKRILAEYVPECEAMVFGSRITEKAAEYSDVDIALFGSEKLDWRTIEALKDAFSESDLPYTVDIVDGNSVSESFRKIIDSRHEVIQQPHR